MNLQQVSEWIKKFNQMVADERWEEAEAMIWKVQPETIPNTNFSQLIALALYLSNAIGWAIEQGKPEAWKLARAVLKYPDEWMQEKMSSAISMTSKPVPKEVISDLARVVREGASTIARQSAIRTLAVYSDREDVFEALLKALFDVNPVLSAAGAWALTRKDKAKSEVIPHIENIARGIMKDAQDPSARLQAFLALTRMGMPSPETMRLALGDTDVLMKLKALDFMKENPQLLEQVSGWENLLNDPDQDVQDTVRQLLKQK